MASNLEVCRIESRREFRRDGFTSRKRRPNEATNVQRLDEYTVEVVLPHPNSSEHVKLNMFVSTKYRRDGFAREFLGYGRASTRIAAEMTLPSVRPEPCGGNPDPHSLRRI